VDTHLAELSRTIDPAELGRRIRNARVAAGMTQTQLAEGLASTAYISRIEAGQRRPESKLLVKLADRAGTTLEELLVDPGDEQAAQRRLELDYADLALRTGDAQSAYERANAVLDASGPREADLKIEAQLLAALALEDLHQLDDAITGLEAVVASSTGGVHWIRAAMNLTRCYRDSGDLARAIETGEAAAAQLEQLGLSGSDEAIQLAVTTASAYFERGDVRHAVRMCRRASDHAENLGSPRAKASAYWNASIMESSQGHLSAAIPLARHALELMEQAEEHVYLALLHNQLGTFLLAADPPELDDAITLLTQAATELQWSEASPTERAHNGVSLAKAHFMKGDLATARELIATALDAVGDSAPIVRARALTLLGQIAFADRKRAKAREHYNAAILALSGAGADRRAAQLWFDLGAMLDAVGDAEGARDAYRRAAASSGLTSQTTQTTATPVK